MSTRVLGAVAAVVLVGAACGSGDASLADGVLLHVDFDGDMCLVRKSDVESESADSDGVEVDVVAMEAGRLTAVFSDTSGRSASFEPVRFDPEISAVFAASDFEEMGGDGSWFPKPSYASNVPRVLDAAPLAGDELSPGDEQFDFDLQPGLHGLVAWDDTALWACRADSTTQLMIDVVDPDG